MSETGTFYRVQWPNSPEFSADNAWSALWGSIRSADGSRTECSECDGTGTTHYAGEEPCTSCDGEGWEDALYGYSCCWSAEDLIAYFASRGEPCDTDAVIVFAGQQVGNGFDGEPLAVPEAITAQMTWAEFKEANN
jgi:hypothetical protein